MSARISKRTRRDAADLCVMMAVVRQAVLDGVVGALALRDFDVMSRAAGATDDVIALADAAFFESETPMDDDTPAPVSWWAEADAMIRTGWSP